MGELPALGMREKANTFTVGERSPSESSEEPFPRGSASPGGTGTLFSVPTPEIGTVHLAFVHGPAVAPQRVCCEPEFLVLLESGSIPAWGQRHILWCPVQQLWRACYALWATGMTGGEGVLGKSRLCPTNKGLCSCHSSCGWS